MHIDNRHDSVLREKQNRKKSKKLNSKKWNKSYNDEDKKYRKYKLGDSLC